MNTRIKEQDGVKYPDQGDDGAVDKMNADLEKLIREQRDKKKALSRFKRILLGKRS